MKKRRKLPYFVNWIISGVVFIILFATFYGLINCVLFYEGDKILFSRESMIYLMYLFCGISFIGGYVIHGWLEVETVYPKEGGSVE